MERKAKTAASGITLSVSTILNGTFYQAGVPIPGDVQIPPAIAAYKAEPGGESRLDFRLNETYAVNPTDRSLRRHVRGLQRANAIEEALEGSLQAQLDPTVEEALADAARGVDPASNRRSSSAGFAA